ncbi:C40 family peptidase [Streptomyces cavernae]|uniref:C40 family peptidase n=1 Tax=Streptomyces cavernae TaxID=2259034 RepID=UPI000FEB8D64|nr:C40 family peptidase [Streptomyces cavernae]
MSGTLLRLVCTAAMAAGAVLAPTPVAAVPKPAERSAGELLADLGRLYREAERATERYNATEERLRTQRAEVARIGRRLARARISLHHSRDAAGRLARQQYQGADDITPLMRMFLADDPQRALEQGHVIRQLARERAETVNRLTEDERTTARLAVRARTALDGQLALAERQKKSRDAVRERLAEVEKLLASLNAEQRAAVAASERREVARAQRTMITSGVLGGTRTPSPAGEAAVRYALRQIGKPYVWGATGPHGYDCSGLTSRAWANAGRPIPRTSQAQWARLRRVSLHELRPGDLVVYFPDATHVAMYLGGGKVVQAPRPGTTVTVSPIAANPVLGAVRPDPGGEPARR